MSNKSYKKTIRESAITLLRCGDDFALMKQAVDNIYQALQLTN